MKRRALLVRLAAAPAILPFFAAHLRAAATDLTGTWTGTLVRQDNSGGDAETPAYVILKQNGREVTGSGGPSESEQYPLSKGLLEGDTFTFEIQLENGSMKFKLIANADSLEGDVTRSGGDGETRQGKLTLKRRKA